MEKKLTIKWFKSIDSTNLQAHRELPHAEEGTVWVADFQTAGRGQRGNSWESSKGENLLFTILLRPDFVPVADQFSISQITALAIVKYLESKGLQPKIKWPNDIYINDKKICGILIEHTLSGANLSASILGIGININQMVFESDAPNPTSLLLELQQRNSTLPPELWKMQQTVSTPRSELPERDCKLEQMILLDRPVELELVLQQLFSLYEELHVEVEKVGCGEIEDLSAGAINREYLFYMYRYNQLSGYIETETGNKIMGRIKGINRYGCLLLEKEDGIIQEYAFQQIRYIKK